MNEMPYCGISDIFLISDLRRGRGHCQAFKNMYQVKDHICCIRRFAPILLAWILHNSNVSTNLHFLRKHFFIFINLCSDFIIFIIPRDSAYIKHSNAQDNLSEESHSCVWEGVHSEKRHTCFSFSSVVLLVL